MFKVDETGEISIFKGSQTSENIRCFLDRLKNHTPNLIGTQLPKPIHGISKKAQWLSGIAAGAWFEFVACVMHSHALQYEGFYKYCINC